MGSFFYNNRFIADLTFRNMVASLSIISSSPEETHSIGEIIGSIADASDLILLIGQLGSGKTVFTSGIGDGMGVNGRVASPTFVIVRWHHGSIPLYHVDLYRIETRDDVEGLGLEEYFNDGVCVVEWADRSLEIFPMERLTVQFQYGDNPEQRVMHVEGEGERYERIVGILESTFHNKKGSAR